MMDLSDSTRLNRPFWMDRICNVCVCGGQFLFHRLEISLLSESFPSQHKENVARRGQIV
jgi:hypothetical protein